MCGGGMKGTILWSSVKCCQCGAESENKDIAEMSGWVWKETSNGIRWTCNDCAVENYIEKMENE